MFNPLNLLSKLLGSSNQKELNRIQKIVHQVNLLEKNVSILPDEDFPKKTELTAYRKALRDWPASADFPTESKRPVMG